MPRLHPCARPAGLIAHVLAGACRRRARASLLLGLHACIAVAPAQDSLFIDPEDGWLDATRFLRGRYGFMPVPMIITEPAVGYGGGLGLAFLHEPVGGTEDKPAAGPPSISAAFGALTENGTWGIGGAHFGSWFDDNVRYLGALASAHPEIDYWIDDRPIAYSLNALGLLQRLQVRVPDSAVFVGARYTFIDAEVSGDVLDVLPDDVRETRSGGLGASLSYDTRDNILTPTRGLDLTYVGMAFAPVFGGEDEYQQYEARNRIHIPVVPRFGFGLRVDAQYASEETPFWHQPAVDMRGVSAVRYQDNAVLVGEAELRWNAWRRFWLIGFGGAGSAAPEFDEVIDGTWHPAGGGGVRYVISRGFGLLAGIDVATSEDDTAFYITVGNSWGR